MATTSFEAQIRNFAGKTERQMLDVFRESVQDVMDDASLPKAKGGRMPVDTGFLRNSVVSGLNGSFTTYPSGRADTSGDDSRANYELTIARMKLGDTSQFAWTAVYAYVREMDNHYVGGAAAKWPAFVAANARRVK